MMDAAELLEKLDAERDAYVTTLQQVHEVLASTVAASSPGTPKSPVTAVVTSAPSSRSNRVAVLSESDSKSTGSASSPLKSTLVSGEDEDASDDDEALYVQDLLPTTTLDDEQLRNHLKHYKWDTESQQILKSLFSGPRQLKHPHLFTNNHESYEEGAHYSLYQVFDVGNDGTPLPLHTGTAAFKNMSKEQALWHLIKDVNVDTTRLRRAIGRIIILREPCPVVFGAIHLAMNGLLDMDEIFKHLVEQGTTTAYTKRAFHEDPRKRKSFIFSFEYFTLIGDECRPMSWQQSHWAQKRHDGHIPITRCSSVVALSLVGEPIRKIKNSARRARTQYGYVYSPWAPWHVLNIQCYPDWKSNTGSHDSTKHYVNGPEAFLNTLLVEFKDAQKRIEAICQRIGMLVTPPADFMFNGDLRDKLLFEDNEFTYSRRYFWAFQTLGTMNHSLKAMVDAYEGTFTDAVWEGRHQTLWPLDDGDSPRNKYWKRRMASLRVDFGHEVDRLKVLLRDNEVLRKEIRELRDNLFSGTSVLESRRSVEQTEITVQQGQNIKLLTLVNLFFLPLTFVTSIFGMTNMPTEAGFWRFGVVMVTVCVPFFLLIGSMNTNRGMYFWRHDVRRMVVRFGYWITRWNQKSPGPKKRRKSTNSDSELEVPPNKQESRSLTAMEGIRERTGQVARKERDADPDTGLNSNNAVSSSQPSSEVQATASPNAKAEPGSTKANTEAHDDIRKETKSKPQPPRRATTTNIREVEEGKSKGLRIWQRVRQNSKRNLTREYTV